MILRLAAAALAAALLLAGCQLIEAADEPHDLYTVTPKSTFDPDLPSVYLAARGRGAGRRRQPQHRPHRHRPDADLVGLLRQGGVDRPRAADGADAHRRFLREHAARSSPWRANRSASAPTTCCSPTCATSRRSTTTASRRSCACASSPSWCACPTGRSSASPPSSAACGRAPTRCPRWSRPSTRRWAASSSGWSPGRLRTPPARPPSDDAPYNIERFRNPANAVVDSENCPKGNDASMVPVTDE